MPEETDAVRCEYILLPCAGSAGRGGGMIEPYSFAAGMAFGAFAIMGVFLYAWKTSPLCGWVSLLYNPIPIEHMELK
jgi:hypothetical protein